MLTEQVIGTKREHDAPHDSKERENANHNEDRAQVIQQPHDRRDLQRLLVRLQQGDKDEKPARHARRGSEAPHHAVLEVVLNQMIGKNYALCKGNAATGRNQCNVVGNEGDIHDGELETLDDAVPCVLRITTSGRSYHSHCRFVGRLKGVDRHFSEVLSNVHDNHSGQEPTLNPLFRINFSRGII